MYPAAENNISGMFLVSALFSIVTIITMLAVVLAFKLGFSKINFRPLEKLFLSLVWMPPTSRLSSEKTEKVKGVFEEGVAASRSGNGFEKGVLGPELMMNMRNQACRLGADLIFEDATAVDFSSKPFRVAAGSETFESKCIIIATGASVKWLGLESESRLRGL
jgi:hypothetical protein